MFLLDSLPLVRFLGFAISWIGGFARLSGGVFVFFRKAFLSWFKLPEGLLFILVFLVFDWDCELVIIFGLLGFLSWFGIIF